MPKRGHVQPWKVTFRWSNGVGGTIACGSEEDALFRGQRLADRTSPGGDDHPQVEVWHRDRPDQRRRLVPVPVEEDLD